MVLFACITAIGVVILLFLLSLHCIHTKDHHIMSALDDLTAAVQAEATVSASAVTLLQGLKAKLDAAIAANDPAKLAALSTELGASTKALADAVLANTPAVPPAPAPPPAPTP